MTTSEQDLPTRATTPPEKHSRIPTARAAHLDYVDQLLVSAAGATGAARLRLLNEAVVRFKPVADSLAGRYSGRGIPSEDLAQVAALALVKASRGYRPDRGTRFAAYAIPTINGELRRHFRDHGWDIRPTRRLQELRIQFRAASIELTHEQGRSPSEEEVARYLGADTREVREMLVAGEGYSTVSLDAPLESLENEAALGDHLGVEDGELAEVVDRVSVEPLLAALPDRERDVLALRFYAGWTQQQIAEELGITQMQVSRLLTRTLRRLHEAIEP
jgi:RNA polymerase sigma-B factor